MKEMGQEEIKTDASKYLAAEVSETLKIFMKNPKRARNSVSKAISKYPEPPKGTPAADWLTLTELQDFQRVFSKQEQTVDSYLDRIYKRKKGSTRSARLTRDVTAIYERVADRFELEEVERRMTDEELVPHG